MFFLSLYSSGLYSGSSSNADLLFSNAFNNNITPFYSVSFYNDLRKGFLTSASGKGNTSWAKIR